MKRNSSDRETDPLQSALQRLPIPILTFDGDEKLHPLNRAGVGLAQAEALHEDLFRTDPLHPLADLIRSILAESRKHPAPIHTVVFPSGNTYEIEASTRSQKGRARWIVLLLRRPEERLNRHELFDVWDLTGREREVVDQLLQGRRSEEICDRLCISQNTLKAHIRSVFSKSGSRTRAELLSKLLR